MTPNELKSRHAELTQELAILSRQIEASEGQSAYRCWLDDKEVVTKKPCTGWELRSHLDIRCSNYGLYLEGSRNSDDMMVRDNDVIPNGGRVYSVPNAIIGG